MSEHTKGAETSKSKGKGKRSKSTAKNDEVKIAGTNNTSSAAVFPPETVMTETRNSASTTRASLLSTTNHNKRGILTIPVALENTLRETAESTNIISRRDKSKKKEHRKGENTEGKGKLLTNTESVANRETPLVKQSVSVVPRPKAYRPEDLVIDEAQRQEMKLMKSKSDHRFLCLELQKMVISLSVPTGDFMSGPWITLKTLLASTIDNAVALLTLLPATSSEITECTRALVSLALSIVSCSRRFRLDNVALLEVLAECLNAIESIFKSIKSKYRESAQLQNQSAFPSSFASVLQGIGKILYLIARIKKDQSLVGTCRKLFKVALGLNPSDSTVAVDLISLPSFKETKEGCFLNNNIEQLKLKALVTLRVSLFTNESGSGGLSQESLSEYFEQVRQLACQQLQNATALSGLGFREHYEKAVMSLLGTVSILYSRVEADKFTHYFEQLKRHLNALFQIVLLQGQQAVRIRHPSVLKGQSDSSKSILFQTLSCSKELSWLTDEVTFDGILNDHSRDMLEFYNQAVALQALCYDAITLAILLCVHLTKKYREIQEFTSIESEISSVDANIAIAERMTSEIDEKTINNSIIFRLLAVPGILDIFTMFCGIISCIAGVGNVSSVMNSESDSAFAIRCLIINQAMHLSVIGFEVLPILRIMPPLMNLGTTSLRNALTRQSIAKCNEAFQVVFSFAQKLDKIGKKSTLEPSEVTSLPEWLELLVLSNSSLSCSCNPRWASMTKLFVTHSLSEALEDSLITPFDQDDHYTMPTNRLSTWSQFNFRLRSFAHSCLHLASTPVRLTMKSITPSILIAFDRDNMRPFIVSVVDPSQTDIDRQLMVLTDILEKNTSTMQLPSERLESVIAQALQPTLQMTDIDQASNRNDRRNEENADMHELKNINNTNPQAPTSLSSSRGILSLSSPLPSSSIIDKSLKEHGQISLSKKSASAFSKSTKPLPLIVIDAANVAMRHGLNARFSCKGIRLVMKYFSNLGHSVIAFLPDYYMNYEQVGQLRRLESLGLSDSQKISKQSKLSVKIPDDINMLQDMMKEGLLVGTPPQDYDVSSCTTSSILYVFHLPCFSRMNIAFSTLVPIKVT